MGAYPEIPWKQTKETTYPVVCELYIKKITRLVLEHVLKFDNFQCDPTRPRRALIELINHVEKYMAYVLKNIHLPHFRYKMMNLFAEYCGLDNCYIDFFMDYKLWAKDDDLLRFFSAMAWVNAPQSVLSRDVQGAGEAFKRVWTRN